MGKTTRKRYGAEFKAKVALEAIRGEVTLSQLGAWIEYYCARRPHPAGAARQWQLAA